MRQGEYLSLCLTALAAARRAEHRVHGAPQPSAPAPVTSSAPPLDFRCALCGKAFASYQALGGHMASHRKPGTAPPFVQNEDATPSAAGEEGEPRRRHVCTVCRRGFATGQALGGHKRFHYLHGPSVSASLRTEAGSRAGWFDLNVAPVDCVKGDDEGEEAQSRCAPAKKKQRRGLNYPRSSERSCPENIHNEKLT